MSNYTKVENREGEEVLDCLSCNDRMWNSTGDQLYCTKQYCEFKTESDWPLNETYDEVTYHKMLAMIISTIPKGSFRRRICYSIT